MLQLREKHLCDKALLGACEEILAVTAGTATRFIVNDRADIALLSGADGVHLGQDDISLEAARRILGPDKIVGLSTHSIAQAREALAQHPDYIGFGPIYPTPTKVIPDPVVGTENLKTVLGFATVPVVAIGGIDLATAQKVTAVGAQNFCAVRYLMETPSLADRIDQLNVLLK